MNSEKNNLPILSIFKSLSTSEFETTGFISENLYYFDSIPKRKLKKLYKVFPNLSDQESKIFLKYGGHNGDGYLERAHLLMTDQTLYSSYRLGKFKRINEEIKWDEIRELFYIDNFLFINGDLFFINCYDDFLNKDDKTNKKIANHLGDLLIQISNYYKTNFNKSLLLESHIHLEELNSVQLSEEIGRKKLCAIFFNWKNIKASGDPNIFRELVLYQTSMALKYSKRYSNYFSVFKYNIETNDPFIQEIDNLIAPSIIIFYNHKIISRPTGLSSYAEGDFFSEINRVKSLLNMETNEIENHKIEEEVNKATKAYKNQKRDQNFLNIQLKVISIIVIITIIVLYRACSS